MRHIIHYGNGAVTADCNFFSVVRCAGRRGFYEWFIWFRFIKTSGLIWWLWISNRCWCHWTGRWAGPSGTDCDLASRHEKGSTGRCVVYRGGLWRDDAKNDKTPKLAFVSTQHQNRKSIFRIRALSSYVYSINTRVITRDQNRQTIHINFKEVTT